MLARLHLQLRRRPFAQRFTLFTRGLLALGFIAPGLTKVFGLPFAPGLDPTQMPGLFFDVFHQTGGYYVLAGLVQVMAGALLLSRRTALLGACLYLPTIGNIFALVVSVPFGTGTPILVGLMLLGATWLLVWDAHRLVPLFVLRPTIPARPLEPALWDTFVPEHTRPRLRIALRAAYVIGWLGAFEFTLTARGLSPIEPHLLGLVAVLIGGVLTLGLWTAHALQHRVQRV